MRTVGRAFARCSGWCLLAWGLTACGGRQSVLNPAGQQADRIAELWWRFLAILAVTYLLVIVFLAMSLFRGRHRPPSVVIDSPEPNGERRMGITVSSFVAVTVVILFFFLVSDFATGKALHDLSDPAPLQIKVTGHQWWWEVAYQDPVPSKIVTTANEIHVPVGKAVQFQLNSVDVIHSFWAPNFHGKKDLVPGHPTTHGFRAERAGRFRGQCAEFCGLQHAHMRFVIVAEPPQEFARWLAAQQQPPPQPSTEVQKRGQQVFLQSTCMMCHTIQGTGARGMVGPDLSHVGSREMLAAGTLPNNLGHLAGWIVDPQQIKPGVRMPQNQLSAADLRAVIEYLESLK